MTAQTWFSAKLRRLCFVSGHGCSRANDSVFVFRAKTFEDAFGRALELGREHEEEYQNVEGETVSWRFERIVALDVIRSESLDGAEVHSTFEEVVFAPDCDVDAVLHPELSKPAQTL